MVLLPSDNLLHSWTSSKFVGSDSQFAHFREPKKYFDEHQIRKQLVIPLKCCSSPQKLYYQSIYNCDEYERGDEKQFLPYLLLSGEFSVQKAY